MQSLKTLLELSPDDYFALRLFASIALSEGNLENAIDTYKRVLERNPQSENYSNLGLAYMLRSDYMLANSLFNQAVKQSPNHPVPLLNLADSEKLLGKRGEANRYYQQVIKLLENKDDWESQLLKAQAYTHLGYFEQGISALDQARFAVPDNAEVMFNAALIYTLAGESISAVVQTEKALNKGIGTIWFHLPWFDDLCRQTNFISLLQAAGDNSRCKAVLKD